MNSTQIKIDLVNGENARINEIVGSEIILAVSEMASLMSKGGTVLHMNITLHSSSMLSQHESRISGETFNLVLGYCETIAKAMRGMIACKSERGGRE